MTKLRLRRGPHIGRSRTLCGPEALHEDAERLSAVETGKASAMSIRSQLPSELEARVSERLQAAASEPVARRIWERDGTLWAPEGTPEVTDRLGWLDIAERLAADVEDLEAFAAQVREDGITDAVLLGMGGSSLAPEVFRRSFGEGGLHLHVLDSTHPDQVRAVHDAIDLDK